MKLLKLITLLLPVAFLLTTHPAQARIKCWTNKDGVKECGDRIPPEYSQKKHEVVNKQGLVVEEEERARTDEEIAEEKRRAELEAEKERIAAEKRREDEILLQTFSKVEDIETARDHKISALDSSIALAERRNGKIQEDLDNRVKQAAADERAGKEPPEELLKDIEDLQRQIKTNNEFIAEKRQEQKEVREAYAEDIKRFNELKSASAE